MPGSIEYRKLTPEEKLHVARLQGFVFSFEPNEKEIREKIEKGEYDSSHCYGAVDACGRVLAGMEAMPLTMWFDGHKAPMAGISGVASVPDSRRQGNVRKVFEKVFEDLREEGVVFSHLYPFSFDYYRKFGYEYCGTAPRYTLPVAPARKFPNCGTAHEFIGGDAVRSQLIEVYEAYASRHNLMVSRTEKRWDEILNITLFGADRLYYWKNAGGCVRAWVKFKRENDKVIIHDIAWADHESMFGILQFVGMFEGHVEKMVFRASPEVIPELYWNNPFAVETGTDWLGMNRVVNAKRALELMKKPEGEGRFTVKVEDAFAPWNSGFYAVEYGGGACRVETLPAESGADTVSGSAADIEVSERAMLQLVLGMFELEQIAHRSDVRIGGDREMLKKVFPKKPLLLTDFF